MGRDKVINILKAIYELDIIPEEVLREVAEKGYSNNKIYGALVLDFPNTELEEKFEEIYEEITGEKSVDLYEDLIAVFDEHWEDLPEIAKETFLPQSYIDAYEKLVEYGY